MVELDSPLGYMWGLADDHSLTSSYVIILSKLGMYFSASLPNQAMPLRNIKGLSNKLSSDVACPVHPGHNHNVDPDSH
jgi:hypothetical protein